MDEFQIFPIAFRRAKE